MKCPICHLDNQDDARFCCHCGNVISGESLAVSITDAAKTIGCTTQTILNLIDKGYLTQMGADAHRKTYVSRESLLRFCNVIPDFKGKITTLRKLYSQVSKAQIDLQSQINQFESDSLFSNIPIRNNVVKMMMNLCLTETEKRILNESLFEHISMGELAEKYDSTKERIRQIISKAIRKLSANRFSDFASYESLQSDVKLLKERISFLENLLSANNIEFWEHSMPLHALGFSYQTLSALLLSGFYYLSELTKYSRIELYTMLKGNLSQRTMNEIEAMLNRNNMSLRPHHSNISSSNPKMTADLDDEEEDDDIEWEEEDIFYDEDDRALNSIIKHGKIQGISK